jgi:hypothetical protein
VYGIPSVQSLTRAELFGIAVLGEVTRMKDGCSKNLTRTRNVPPKCNKQVTSKQQTRCFLTSIN